MEKISVPETKMTKPTGLLACAWLLSASFVAAGAVQAADLTPGPWPPSEESAGPVYGYFNPVLDPRCRIVAQPQANLFGDTTRFRPASVCQSRGLYADSVLFP